MSDNNSNLFDDNYDDDFGGAKALNSKDKSTSKIDDSYQDKLSPAVSQHNSPRDMWPEPVQAKLPAQILPPASKPDPPKAKPAAGRFDYLAYQPDDDN